MNYPIHEMTTQMSLNISYEENLFYLFRMIKLFIYFFNFILYEFELNIYYMLLFEFDDEHVERSTGQNFTIEIITKFKYY